MYLYGWYKSHELMNLVYLKFWGSQKKSVLHVLVWVVKKKLDFECERTSAFGHKETFPGFR